MEQQQKFNDSIKFVFSALILFVEFACWDYTKLQVTNMKLNNHRRHRNPEMATTINEI